VIRLAKIDLYFLENVLGYFPQHLKDQTKAAMRAAFR
jgi:hypothetical protein